MQSNQTIDAISRRRFLTTSLMGTVAQFMPGDLFARQDYWSLPRSLWLYRPVTKEQVRVVYFADGKVIPKGYAALCSILRDVRANEAIPMSLVLLDILCGIQGMMKHQLGLDHPLWSNSGHRNSKTNSMTEGAAKDSKHETGEAWDGGMPGVSAEFVSSVALYMHAGGVGYYEGKNFTHVDTGRVRFWRG